MDNLTHTMVGSVLAQAGLKRTSGLSTPVLMIAANVADMDAACTIFGMRSLEMRRGLTHGPLALALVPPLLVALAVLFDRRQGARGTRPAARLPVRPAWLLACGFVGMASHVGLDWLNNYGVRLLEPFSSQWFYGSMLFILDPWLLLILLGGSWLSRRRDGRVDENGRPALFALVLGSLYIAVNGWLSIHAETMARRVPALAGRGDLTVVADPVPIAFWRRTMLWRDRTDYGTGRFSLFEGVTVDSDGKRDGMDDPRVAAIRRTDRNARALLFWARMPIARVEGDAMLLTDQRVESSLMPNSLTVRVPPSLPQ